MSGVSIKIEGEEQLNYILSKLPVELEKKALLPGLRQAAKPLIAAMKSKVPKRTGSGAKSIGLVVVKGKKAAIKVGPRTGKGLKNDGWYLRFVEYGTKTRQPRGSRKNARLKIPSGDGYVYPYSAEGMKPQPFVRPAYDETKEQIVKEMGNNIARSIERFVNKYGYIKH